MTRVGVVVVSWESGPELVACLASLARAGAALAVAPAVAVVDNASADFDESAVRGAFPSAIVIRNPANAGFAAAANQGAATLAAEVLLFLNPDTVAEPEALAELAAGFEDRHEVIGLAPRLLDDPRGHGDGQEAFQHRHLPTIGQLWREQSLLDRVWPGNPWLRRDRYLDRPRELPFAVEQPAAAALALRASAFTAVGGFDPSFSPAWFEDVDLCRRLAPLGPILHWPASRFVHVGGAAAATLGYDRFLPLYTRNQLHYWRKHHAAASVLAARIMIAAGMALRMALLPLRPTPPRSRSEAWRAYWRALGAAAFRPPRPGEPRAARRPRG